MDAAGLDLLVVEVGGQKGLVKGLKLAINTWLFCRGHPQLSCGHSSSECPGCCVNTALPLCSLS